MLRTLGRDAWSQAAMLTCMLVSHLLPFLIYCASPTAHQHGTM